MYTAITQNKVKTVVLMIGFVVFIVAFGWILSLAFNRPGLLVFLSVFAIVYAIFSYYSGARMALALSGAQPIVKADAPELYRVVENLSITAGLPTPDIYIIDDPAPNAFATGRDPNHAHVAVTRGLLAMMNETELEGVIAHEMSHVGNYDIRLMAVVLALVTVVSLISHWFLRMSFFGDSDSGGDNNGALMIVGLIAAVVAPLVAMMLQLAVSRKREFLADATGALLTRYPEGLASALEKIATYTKPMEHASTATAHLFISSPLGNRGIGGAIASLFSTHPPIDERVARLHKMEQAV
ncbi:MAG TPA: M48 family metallopeptidase [Candidatus Saccharimonadales bacterium]|nr:M48 family metallopeptidase [Candidatus Saccharimonadales bacterium]